MQNDQNQASGTSGALTSSGAEGPTSVKEDRRKEERRLNARYQVSASLEAVELQSKAHFTGRVSDLSIGGCYVDTITAFPKDATLKIRLAHDGKFFETKARVIASSAGMGMGLMFTETDPGQLQTLEGWIRELSGELLPCEAELPEIRSQQLAEPDSKIAQLDALNELVIELMRTGVLSDLKGREILKKISRR
jgi:hypothetical protein